MKNHNQTRHILKNTPPKLLITIKKYIDKDLEEKQMIKSKT